MAARPHPPAWYPDPKDPARIRRWDGRAWTSDVRPLPEWLRTLRLSPGPAGRSSRSNRGLWATSAALLALGALVMVILDGSGDVDEGRINDTGFVRQANRRCAQAQQEVVEPNRKAQKGVSQARRVEALASGWEQMVSDLRRLDVGRQDRAKVDRWLRAWDSWTRLGHDYAAALDADDSASAQQVLERSRPSKQEISRFAYVNGMNACIFR
ncbi:MAG: DUF2510 domain-containing protein [Actinobacteria bacterium]|nr:DUF2510 domain-containing protein [Actinomycetota bacterium]